MQEVQQSIQQVISSPGFFWWVGVIISIGMLAGAKFDNRIQGFVKSIILIFPYSLVLLLTTLNRLYIISYDKPLNADAYNGIVTLVIITLAYIVGLFLGHMAVKKGHEAGVKGK